MKEKEQIKKEFINAFKGKVTDEVFCDMALKHNLLTEDGRNEFEKELIEIIGKIADEIMTLPVLQDYREEYLLAVRENLMQIEYIEKLGA